MTSKSCAGERAIDVYMGIDVFGRNTFGGGGMHSDVALRAAFSAGRESLMTLPKLCTLEKTLQENLKDSGGYNSIASASPWKEHVLGQSSQEDVTGTV